MIKKLILATLLSVSSLSYAEEKFELTYNSFVDYVETGKVKSIDIYEHSVRDMEVTVIEEGKEKLYKVDKPYSAVEDIIFMKFLKEHKIPYKALKKDFSDRNIMSHLTPLLIMAIPHLISVILLVLAIMIYIKAKNIEKKI